MKSSVTCAECLVRLNKQFTWSEGGRLVAQLVPEPVATSGVAELRSNDASERWSHHAARQWPLRDSTGPEVHVRGMPVVQRTCLNNALLSRQI
jgi:hypothetical protein